MAARLLGRPSLLTRRQMVPMFKSQRPDRGVVQKYSCYSSWPLEVVVLPTLLLLLLVLLHGTHVWVGVPAQKHTTSLLSSTASWCPCLRARGQTEAQPWFVRSHWPSSCGHIGLVFFPGQYHQPQQDIEKDSSAYPLDTVSRSPFLYPQ